jgi:hypothetical protein
MSISEDRRGPDRDAEGGEDPDEDPGEDLEAMIEQADRPAAMTVGDRASGATDHPEEAVIDVDVFDEA